MPEIKLTSLNGESIENPELVKAMEEFMKLNSQENEARFVSAMKNARFLVPADITLPFAADENGSIKRDISHVRFIIFTGENEQYLPLFTDQMQLMTWKDASEHKRAIMTFDDICSFVKDPPGGKPVTGVIINPFLNSMRVSSETVQRMKNYSPMKPGQPTKISVGTLKEEPAELTGALRPFLAKNSGINKAYMRAMLIENKEKPNYLLVLDLDIAKFDSKQIKELFDSIASEARPHLHGVDISITHTETELGKAALTNAVPFYEK